MTRTTTRTPRSGPAVRLHRERLRGAAPARLDPAQQAVVEHRGSRLRVLGAPGTGKTTALVEAVVDRVQRDGLDPGHVLVLAPSRLAAARVRELVTARLAATVREPLARTPQSFAFGVLRRAAALAGEPAPRLITGPEQDVVLRDLLAGHVQGEGAAPRWPHELRPALGTRGFRGQLRDLLMRAVERGIGPADLAALGEAHARPEWVAAADLLEEYLDVTALATPGGFDPAAIATEAVSALAADPALLEAVRDQVRLVVVDDAHEVTAAVADLVRAVAGPRPDVLLAGDPDAATQGFRGADPGLLLGERTGGAADDAEAAARVVVLGTSWRQPEALRRTTARVAGRIGAVGGGRQRQVQQPPDVVRPAGDVAVHVVRTPAHEVALVADLLRRRHLVDGVPWSDMAVLVRGRGRSSSLRRGLAQAGVPVDVPLTELPVRDQPAVVPLLDAYEVGLAIAAAAVEPLTVEVAESLLLSPLGGADTMALRRLRRALRAHELAVGSGRSSDALLVEALLEPGVLGVVDPATAAPARRVATVLAAAAAAAGSAPDDGRPGQAFASGVTAESVLWAVWSAAGLSGPWRRSALAGGPPGARADRDLDAVVALFDAAARFVDRLPQAGPREFVEYLRGQDLPGDTLAERGAADAVALLTPASAAGREWRVVAVAGVQEGVWPDLRLRGSLLGAEHLVDVVAGRQAGSADGPREAARAAAAAVRDDETRLFHVAVSRARESLVVTAVRDDELQPSSFLDLLDPPPDSLPAAGWDDEGVRATTAPPLPLSLAGVVSRLRQVVADPTSSAGDAAAAAGRLARLARAGVPGAHPDDWYGLAPLTDDSPLRTEHPVRVSPSRVEEFDRCGLRWLLQQAGGTPAGSASQGLGNLVHELAAELPHATTDELLDELRRRWHVLGLRDGWVGDIGRRRAEQVVTKLGQYLQTARDRELVGTELLVDVELDLGDAPVRLTGRVDRLERDAAGLHVVDLKTGKVPPRADAIPEQAQLGVYQLAVQAGAFDDVAPGAPSAGASLVQLGSTAKTPREQAQPPLPDDGGWAAELLQRVAGGMAGAGFDATLNEVCDRCPVRTSCPARGEGRRVTS